MSVEDDDRSALAEDFARLALWCTHQPGQTLAAAPSDVQMAFQSACLILGRLTTGQIDPWTGRRIDKIIRKASRFIVFLDPCLNVKWWWVMRPDLAIISSIQARIDDLTYQSAFLLQLPKGACNDESIPAPQLYSAEAVNIRCVIGEAMALALTSGTVADCETVLQQAERHIAVAKDQRCRPIFVGCFVIAVSMVGIGLLAISLDVFGPRVAEFRFGISIQDCMKAAFAGCLGALVSAVSRTTDLKLEPAAKIPGLAIEACARALIGAAAGVLVSLAFDGGLLGKQALQTTFQEPVRLFLCLAAGISERILPALVGKAQDMVSKGRYDSARAVPPPATEPKGIAPAQQDREERTVE